MTVQSLSAESSACGQVMPARAAVAGSLQKAKHLPSPPSPTGTLARYNVTVIAHNEQKYIRGTLDSIKQQDVKPNRTIVVDDGSTDATPEILAGMSGIEVITRAPHTSFLSGVRVPRRAIPSAYARSQCKAQTICLSWMPISIYQAITQATSCHTCRATMP